MMNMNRNNGTRHEIARRVSAATNGPALVLEHSIESAYGFAALVVKVTPLASGCYEVFVQNFLMTYGGGVKRDFGARRLSLSRTAYTFEASLHEAVAVAYRRFYRHIETGADKDYPELDVIR